MPRSSAIAVRSLGFDVEDVRDPGMRYANCLVPAFEGTISRGRRPEVGGETVRFLPELLHDAKGALGSGGALRGEMVRIEAIDLKVW